MQCVTNYKPPRATYHTKSVNQLFTNNNNLTHSKLPTIYYQQAHQERNQGNYPIPISLKKNKPWNKFNQESEILV